MIRGDRPALVIDGSEKGLPEKLDRFVSGLRHIQERWENRLSGKEPVFWEGYLKGDFSVLLIFDRIVGPDDAADVDERVAGHMNICPANLGSQIAYPVDLDGRDDEVVFVNLVELGDGPENVVSSGVPVRLHVIENKSFNIGEGHLYRRLSDGVFEVFPRFMEGEGAKPGLSGRTPKSHPNVIEGRAQIVDRIPDDQGNMLSNLAEVGEFQFERTITLFGKGEFVGFTAPDLIHDRFKLVDVAIGPYDL